MNDNIMNKMGFGQEVELKNNGMCPSCKAPVDQASFRDEVSKREYKISGLCQACQDEVFGGPEEDEEQIEMSSATDAAINDWQMNDDDMPDDLKAHLYPEEPEDFRNDDYVADRQDFQDED